MRVYIQDSALYCNPTCATIRTCGLKNLCESCARLLGCAEFVRIRQRMTALKLGLRAGI
jgi:hypothetical protein